MSNRVAVVVGGGAIGLSCARSLAHHSVEVFILERNKRIGMETSSRNSEVIHAGLYYPAKSLKANFCVRGKSLLYNYLESRRIPYNRCGKLIVACNNEEINTLETIKHRAQGNGVSDLRILDAEMVRSMEPSVVCKKALYSPSTGVFDSSSYMESLLGDAEERGARIVYNCEVLNVAVTSSTDTTPAFTIETTQGPISCDLLINSAGLQAIQVAKMIDKYPKELLPKQYFSKGNYFQLTTAPPFRHLVYPLPSNGGLGVHATIDMGGRVKFGPDSQWIKRYIDHDVHGNSENFEDLYVHENGLTGKRIKSLYQVDSKRIEKFYSSIRSYYPGLPDDSLVPAYAGIRPKLCGPSDLNKGGIIDFVVDTPKNSGINGLVNLFGIESPGLTSSLALGEYVTTQLLS